MIFYVMARTYNSYGGHATLNLLPELLLRAAEPFGPAIKELTLTFHFPTCGPARPTLEESMVKHDAYRRSLPKIVFTRAKGRVAIDVSSNLLDGSTWWQTREPPFELLAKAAGEACQALTLLRQRLKASDAFDLEGFLSHCCGYDEALPRSPEQFEVLSDRVRHKRLLRNAAMSPWERLGIDWDEYHRLAREMLDDPFYWEQADDYAPHGNDTGADLLSDFKKWNKSNPSGDPLGFYERLVVRWGFSSASAKDEHAVVLDQAIVGLAFAEIKLRGVCSPQVASLAGQAIDRQRKRALDGPAWPQREEFLISRTRLSNKLRDCTVQ